MLYRSNEIFEKMFSINLGVSSYLINIYLPFLLIPVVSFSRTHRNIHTNLQISMHAYISPQTYTKAHMCILAHMSRSINARSVPSSLTLEILVLGKIYMYLLSGNLYILIESLILYTESWPFFRFCSSVTSFDSQW